MCQVTSALGFCRTATRTGGKESLLSVSINRQQLKRASKSFFRRLGVEVSRYYPRGAERFPPIVDAKFEQLYRRNFQHTMVPWQALFTAYKAARHVARHEVPGAVVECGVWRGGCSVLMAEAMAEESETARDFHLFDTFAGMSEPTEADWNESGGFHAKGEFEKHQRGDRNDWCYGPEGEVRALIAQSRYPSERFHLLKGKVEETLPGQAPDRIALLRLDTDWYESTRHELEQLFPRLSPGGVLLIDDYGAWAGARKAVDEFFDDQRFQILLLPDFTTGALAGVRVA